MNGVYLEAKENPDKSIDEIKEIVSKNLAKDPLHYVKEGQFGVKGLGYTEQKSEEVSGKHKSSGYSDKLKTMVKESLMGGGVVTTGNPNSFAAQQAQMINAMMQEQEDADSMPMDEESYDEGQMMKDKESSRMEAELEEEKEKEVKKDKKGKAKKESIQGVMSRIERVGSGVALEAKIDAIDEEINVRNERLTMLDENDAMAELMDKGKLKELRKDMKMLEKQKAKYAKMYEKCTGKAYTKNEIVDETNI